MASRSKKSHYYLATESSEKKTKHPNAEDYPHQEVFFIPLNNYVHLVTYIQDDETIFLKTAFPSRKATKELRKEIEPK